MKKQFCLILLALAIGLSYAEAMTFAPKAPAQQESDFERLRAEMDENSLPLVNLIVDTALVRLSRFTEGEIEIADYRRRTDAATEFVRYHCKLRYRGASSARFEKKSFAVKLLDEAGEDLDASILGIRNENSWILDAMAIDRARMRNRVCFDIWNGMSSTPYTTKYGNRNGTEGLFVELFLNGAYHGLYCMSDKIDRKLLALKKVKAANDSTMVVRGLLYKGVAWNERTDIYLLSYADDNVDSVAWNSWELKYPEEYPSAETWQPLMDLIDFCSEGTTDEAFRQEWQEHFYYGNLVDYVVFTCALNVGDNAYKNTYLSVADITGDRRFLLTPWDMDMSLGGLWDGGYSENLTLPYRYNNIAPFNRLYAQNTDGFKDEVRDRWVHLAPTLLSVASVHAVLDDYAAAFRISGAWQREYQRWNGNPVPLKEDIADEVGYIKNWYRNNYDNLCQHLGAGAGTVRLAAGETDGATYATDGRRIPIHARQHLPKGIYIKSGKKFMVR